MSPQDEKGNTIELANDAVRSEERTVVFEANAAYNRDGLPMPKNGRHVLNLEMLLYHPFYWEWLNESETAEVLMELYVARTRRTQ